MDSKLFFINFIYNNNLQMFQRKKIHTINYSILRLVVSVIILFFFDVTAAVSAFLFSTLILIVAIKIDNRLNFLYEICN